jgi:hypothetical protein
MEANRICGTNEVHLEKNVTFAKTKWGLIHSDIKTACCNAFWRSEDPAEAESANLKTFAVRRFYY